tara:strand:+ start:755 stop:1981 length:1227 start_codon:yes stop_codon:yes gene_type:complete
MKILFLCHRFPFPPERGRTLRPFNMIKHFTEQGHQVYVASLTRSAAEASASHGIAPYCHHYYGAVVHEPAQFARMLVRLPLLTPSSMGYFHSQDLQRHVQHLLAQHPFDLIVVHNAAVAHYVSKVKHLPKLLDFGDMDSHKWFAFQSFKPFPLNLAYYLEGKKMLRAEKRLARRFDLCSCATKAELATLQSYDTQVPTAWFPNGVNTEHFTPATVAHQPHTICFVGRMHDYPNQQAMLQFCRQTLPLIREQISDVKLIIVGANPGPAVRALSNLPGVTVTGSVSDVRPYLVAAAAMVAPLNIARGTQNKILEAMAMGVPVVASSQAAGGIDAVLHKHFLVADTPSEYASALVKLMRNPSYRQQLAEAGRQRMLTHHQLHLSMQQLDSIVQQCVNSHQEKQQTQREVNL